MINGVMNCKPLLRGFAIFVIQSHDLKFQSVIVIILDANNPKPKYCFLKKRKKVTLYFGVATSQ